MSETRDRFLPKVGQSHVYDAIKEVAKDPHATFVLYGAAACAHFIADKLVELGVKIQHVVIDNDYLDSDKTAYFKGLPIEGVDSLKGRTDLYWVIGFYNDDLTRTVERRMEKVKASGIDVSGVFVIDYALVMRPWRSYTYGFLSKHEQELQATYEALDDELSRKTFVAFLEQRVNVSIGPLDEVRVPDQYFPDEVQLGEDEVFVDCGAYNGDSIQAFLRALKARGRGGYRRIFAFEPDPNRLAELLQNCEGLEHVTTTAKGVWSSNTTLRFTINSELSSEIDEEGTGSVDLATIDSVVRDEPVTFIKMDIQGAEAEALKGAEHTIRKHRPTLAICAYHEHRDLIDLPALIREYHSGYTLYLRAHRSKSNELVLYAVDKDRS